MDLLVPPNAPYHHNEVQATRTPTRTCRRRSLGASETVPVRTARADGHVQQFVLCDFDDHPRERTVMVQVLS